jgi:GTPase SAR1 family protein
MREKMYKNETVFKILVLGDSNVGKTCIVHRFCDESFFDGYISTIGKLMNFDKTHSY